MCALGCGMFIPGGPAAPTCKRGRQVTAAKMLPAAAGTNERCKRLEPPCIGLVTETCDPPALASKLCDMMANAARCSHSLPSHCAKRRHEREASKTRAETPASIAIAKSGPCSGGGHDIFGKAAGAVWINTNMPFAQARLRTAWRIRRMTRVSTNLAASRRTSTKRAFTRHETSHASNPSIFCRDG